MPTDDHRLGAPKDEIEITPEMIEAGTEIIVGYDDGFLVSDEVWVEQIYRAMRTTYLEARRTARDGRSSG